MVITWTDRREMVRSFGTGKVCAEIGVYQGDFSQKILNQSSPSELWLVDPWEVQSGDYDHDWLNKTLTPAMYQHVIKMFVHQPEVKIVRGYSKDMASTIPNDYFDWVYIDADHTWMGISTDVHAWWPKIKSGGWLCGHDFVHCGHIAVKNVVIAWAAQVKQEIHLTKDYPVSWAIQKK